MADRSSSSTLFAIGCFFAGTGVAAGAFGAHALKAVIDPPMLAVYETANRYHMYHAFGILLTALGCRAFPAAGLHQAGWWFVAGILLFAGSLYAVALLNVKWLGAVTPLGGLSFMIGWAVLGWRYWKASTRS